MSVSKSPWLGRFVWHDLMTTDVAKSKAFYTALFEWRLEAVPIDPHVYEKIHTAQGSIGGMFEERDIPMSHWMPYCAVADVDAALARCEELGGSTCVPPLDISGAGRFAVCVDPQGAYFAIYAGGPQSPGADPDVLAPGRVCWNELMTSDDEAAQTFYGALFGWSTKLEDMGPMGLYRLQLIGDAHAGGILRNPMPQTPSWWCVYFAVNDLAQATRKAQSLGASVMVDSQSIPGIGSFSLLQDPLGAMFALFRNL